LLGLLTVITYYLWHTLEGIDASDRDVEIGVTKDPMSARA
jgi:hypothetical protein